MSADWPGVKHPHPSPLPKGEGEGKCAGFTLIELLVAIAVMALMAVLSWRGLDGMLQTQSRTRLHSDGVLTLQTSLAQWGADLDALMPGPDMPALDWDGRVLRMTRRGTASDDAGLRVVAWTRRDVQGTGQWLRWQSPLLRSRGQWQTAWQQAARWGENPGEEERRNEVAVTPLAQWQLFYYRGSAWSHPLSSDQTSGQHPLAAALATATATATDTAIPEGVRLVLTLPPGQALSGTLTRDWVRPTVSGNKS